jgi:hypothetical protein
VSAVDAFMPRNMRRAAAPGKNASSCGGYDHLAWVVVRDDAPVVIDRQLVPGLPRATRSR